MVRRGEGRHGGGFFRFIAFLAAAPGAILAGEDPAPASVPPPPPGSALPAADSAGRAAPSEELSRLLKESRRIGPRASAEKLREMVEGLAAALERRPEDPRVPDTAFKVGTIARDKLKDPRLALPLFNRIVDRHPRHGSWASALHYAADCHYRLGETGEATEGWVRLLLDRPLDRIARQRSLQGLQRAGTERPEQARAALEKALKGRNVDLDRLDRDLLRDLAGTLFLVGLYPTAHKAYDRLAAGGALEARFRKARCLEEMGKGKEAAKEYVGIIRDNPWLNLSEERIDLLAKNDGRLSPRMAHARFTKTPPVVDGDPGDGCWEFMEISGFFAQGDPKAPVQAPLRMAAAYDAENLYLAFSVDEEQMPPKERSLPRDDERILQNPSVHVYLDPGETYQRFFEFAVDAHGHLLDRRGYEVDRKRERRDYSWNAESETDARQEGKSWCVEMVIRLTSIEAAPPVPGKGETWGFNLARSAGKGARQTVLWIPTAGGGYDPRRGGYIRFE